VWSDNVNVRTKPGLDGKIIKKLNNGDTVSIYDYKGTNQFANGVWDRWYKISNTDEIWINGYYTAFFPIYIYTSLPGDDWRHIIDNSNIKNLNTEIIKLMKDHQDVKRSNIAFQITNDRPVASILDNLYIFDNEIKKSDDTNVDMDTYEYYEIIIDNEHNKGKSLLYDIKIGDTVESLTEKLGITRPREYFSFTVYDSNAIDAVVVDFFSNRVLEKVVVKIIIKTHRR
jgi:hypothetical protein